MAYRVEVDLDLCQGHAMCELEAPDYFKVLQASLVRGRYLTEDDGIGNTTINGYVMLDDIGHGTSGDVKLAIHSETGETVAVKVVKNKKKALWSSKGSAIRREIAKRINPAAVEHVDACAWARLEFGPQQPDDL